jgi:hypothetical protein
LQATSCRLAAVRIQAYEILIHCRWSQAFPKVALLDECHSGLTASPPSHGHELRHCCDRVLLLGEGSDATCQAAIARAADAASQLLQRLPVADGADAARPLPPPVCELLRVTVAGAGELSAGELDAAARHICRAAQRDVDGAPSLAVLLRCGRDENTPNL